MTIRSRIFWAFLSYPIFVPLLSLVMSSPAHAREIVFTASPEPTCDRPSRMNNLVCVRQGRGHLPSSATTTKEEVPMLEFSEEESEAAIARFGCDCIACINAVRQSRGLPPVS